MSQVLQGRAGQSKGSERNSQEGKKHQLCDPANIFREVGCCDHWGLFTNRQLYWGLLEHCGCPNYY